MIGPIQNLNDGALKEASKALGEFMNRSNIDYAAAICVSAYFVALEKSNNSNSTDQEAK